jgi:hypothetical protein
MTDHLERASYTKFVHEFENGLKRPLTIREKEFLKWLAETHSLELSSEKGSY